MLRYFVIVFALLLSVAAHAKVRVSDVLRVPVIVDTQTVGPRHRLQWKLNLDRGDRVEFQALLAPNSVHGIEGFICPQSEFQASLNGRTPKNCRAVQRSQTGFNIGYAAPYSGEYMLVVDNAFSVFSSKTVTTQVFVNKRTTDEVRAGFEEAFNGFEKFMKEGFNLEDFDIAIASCGDRQSDESTTPVICSELMASAGGAQKSGAMSGIFMHQFAHALLDKWDLPGVRNEQTADELSAVLMIMAGQREALEQYIAFFASADPAVAAALAAYGKSPHALTPERRQYVGKIIDNPDDHVRRWVRVLYPKMTTKALQQELAKPSSYSDPELAKSILKERGDLQ